MSRSQEIFQAELDRLRDDGLLRELRKRESPHVAGKVQIDGEQFINFGSNDYLGLSADARLVDAIRKAAGYVGCGSAASPLVTGRGAIHDRLERELAAFEQTPAALLFTTGYAANLGTIPAIVQTGDTVFSDQLNHASIVDGCRLSRANVAIYRHADMSHLAELLSQDASRRKLIVTDSLFSMDGDFAPLDRISELAQQHQALLMVDEAHASGVFGANGRGLCEHFAVEQLVDIRIGTLSKAFGSLGGFVAGSRELIELIFNRARSYIFSTAQPESIANATIAALEIVRNEPQRREKLSSLAESLRNQLRNQGFEIGATSSQIIPVILGSPEVTMHVHLELKTRGFFVPAIRPPSVAADACRLRISLTADHQESTLKELCQALAAATANVDYNRTGKNNP
jgi:8-amino-7-oxononanoate synthase